MADVEYVRTKAYGWEGTLRKHNHDRNNPDLPFSVRRDADKAYKKIVAQLNDKKLMAMRERLIRAAKAGDAKAQDKIAKCMRDYLGQDLETGL